MAILMKKVTLLPGMSTNGTLHRERERKKVVRKQERRCSRKKKGQACRRPRIKLFAAVFVEPKSPTPSCVEPSSVELLNCTNTALTQPFAQYLQPSSWVYVHWLSEERCTSTNGTKPNDYDE